MRKDMKAGNYDNSLVCYSVCVYVWMAYALIIKNITFQNNLNHNFSIHLNSIRTWGDDDCFLPNWGAYVKRGEVQN